MYISRSTVNINTQSRDWTSYLEIDLHGQNTPRSKFYDSKIHWFQSFLHPITRGNDGPIVVEKVDTKLQKADIFTKALAKVDYQRLRKLIMGW